MREARKPWAAATLFGLLSAGGVSTARAADCGHYAIEGVRLGMTPKEVRKQMRGPAEMTERQGSGGTGTVRETFLRSPSKLEVTYDEGAAAGGREMVSVQLRFVPPARAAEAFLAGLGEPDSGAERRASGSVTGPVVWLDESCGLVVTADRLVADWWQGGEGAIAIDLEAWAQAREREGSPAAAAIDAWESRPTESWQAVVQLQPGSVIGEHIPADPPAPVAGEAASAVSPAVSSAAESGNVPPPVPPADGRVGRAPIVPRTTIEATGEYQPPKRLDESYVAPRYPRFPTGPRVPAKVTLDVTVDEDGSVGAISVRSVSPPARGFELAAQEAVRKWRYRPATLGGAPVQAKVTVEMEFR